MEIHMVTSSVDLCRPEKGLLELFFHLSSRLPCVSNYYCRKTEQWGPCNCYRLTITSQLDSHLPLNGNSDGECSVVIDSCYST